jgi:hypothetical protein
MKELMEYRRKLVERLAEAADEFCDVTRAGNPSTVVEGEWTLHQVAAHVRDIDRVVYNARIVRTLQEQDPLFQSIDPDEWMKENYNKDEPLAGILVEFRSNVAELLNTLGEASDEAWSRVSRHETLGDGLTLQWWVERSLAHIEEHLSPVGKSN